MINTLPKGWDILQTQEQLELIAKRSGERPQLLFKHSIRCGISSNALHNLLAAWRLDDEIADAWLLDLITYRPLSNAIVDLTGVPHQSPQAILLAEKDILYHSSHFAISFDGISNAISQWKK